MSASPDVIRPQNVSDAAQGGWKVMPSVRKDSGKGSSCNRLISGDASSSGDECNTKVRKPYTITKQRERWTESEHQKFLEALKLYGRAWRRIEEYIGTKTAVQIRSHAQKFFSKLEREASTGSSAGKVQDIEIPPPRPKRKPSHPYPKKAGNGPLNLEDETKELSAVSASGCTEVHDEGFQSGSFNPYINRGLGASSAAAFRRNPFVPGHFFGPQGSMKLFGKTVVAPKNLKPAPHNDSSKECLLNGKVALPNTQTNKADLQQTSGFYHFSKDRKVEPLVSDTNGSCVVTNPSEGLGESLARNSSDSFPAIYESGAAGSHDLSEGEDQQQEGMVEVRSIEHTSVLQKEGGNLNVPLLHGVQHNQPVQHWMNSPFRYHSGLAVPPMVGHGLTDGVPANPLTYWQFMQASAVNYAAYTAAVAAAAAAGWTGSITGRELIEASRANVNEAKVVSSLRNDLSNPTALPSATSSWWPLRGFMPSGYSSPMGAVHQGEQMGIAADTHPLECGKEDPALEHISSQGEHVMDLGTAVEAEMSDVDEVGGKKHTENSPSANSGCMLRTSCARQMPVSESALPDSESHPDMDGTIMPAKCSTQESDTERRVPIESPQNLYSSSDEFDGRVKKQREGSSSGSNTPISECEAPGMLESKKRDSHTLREDNEDTCSDAFKQCHQLCGTTTIESPKGIAKHSEKGRKHQQKDSRHGGSDDSKRLKSSAHDLELRKEVSEEGRKAFRALFTSKLLPQTFAAANMVEGRNACSKNEHVSRPTVFKKESDAIYAPVPLEKASGECINPDRSPQGEAIGDVNIDGKSSTSTTCTNLDMGFGCGVTKEQHEGNSKSFAISSSSGFVPYKRPVCMGASIPEQPSSL